MDNNYLNNNMQVDAAILDFSKAFDKVAHKHLIYKLNYYGIRPPIVNPLFPVTRPHGKI